MVHAFIWNMDHDIMTPACGATTMCVDLFSCVSTHNSIANFHEISCLAVTIDKDAKYKVSGENSSLKREEH